MCYNTIYKRALCGKKDRSVLGSSLYMRHRSHCIPAGLFMILNTIYIEKNRYIKEVCMISMKDHVDASSSRCGVL